MTIQNKVFDLKSLFSIQVIVICNKKNDWNHFLKIKL